MELILLWLFFSLVAAAIASQKGRSGFGLFLISIIFSPLIGIIIALVLARDTATIDRTQLKAGAAKKCPFCAELIKKEAVVCRYCGKDIPTLRPPKQQKQSNHAELTLGEMKKRGLIK